ncbi:hypothetical protein [Acinetobacter vivianii]|uniref:hypothetical protein n=1 Tax=Acinetobacter vivianii TaxID=1776742 RepID=UPI003CFDEA49
MNKEIEKYVCYYLAVYIIVLAIYAFFDYIISCSGNSLNCKVDWTNTKDILQTTAYMLTPIVAIVALLSWKTQHNKLIFSTEAKPLLLMVNDDIKYMTNITSILRNKDLNSRILIDDFLTEILDNTQKLLDNNHEISSKAFVLYGLTEDEELESKRLEYHNYTTLHAIHINNIIDNINSQVTYGYLLKFYDTNMLNFLDINKQYKAKLREFVLA